MLSQSQIFIDHRPLFIQAVPYIFYASVIMIMAGLILPRADSTSPLVYMCTETRRSITAQCVLGILVRGPHLEYLLYLREWQNLRPMATSCDP